MKKLIILFMLSFLTACTKPTAKETPLSEVMLEIKEAVSMSEAAEEDLSDQKSAEKLGISTQSINDGIAYYSTAESNSDKVILVRAKTKEDIEKLEQALSAELTATTSAWKDNDTESKKIENSLLKTKDDCVILAISDKIDKIEEIFDKNL